MKNQIELTQVPVIKHDLISIGASVTKRIDELNVENLVATEDTIKSMKSLRAELNKEATEFEVQRKAVKEAVNSPYAEFEAVYKSEVIDKYKNAVEILKTKIGAFEIKIKEEKQANIERYFDELCLSEKIDFVKFSQLNLKIDLSTSEKKYKEQCNDFIAKVQDDIKLIEASDYQAEIMTEYKATLNASKSITTVRERKANEKLEAERIKRAETSRREWLLRDVGMVYFDIAKSFALSSEDSISIKQSEIENLSNDEFMARYVQIESEIKALNSKKQLNPESAGLENPKPEIKQPLEAPKEIIPEKVFEASFECKGTMSQLKALGEYMRANGIEYKNI